jgi:hypothetical protein
LSKITYQTLVTFAGFFEAVPVAFGNNGKTHDAAAVGPASCVAAAATAHLRCLYYLSHRGSIFAGKQRVQLFSQQAQPQMASECAVSSRRQAENPSCDPEITFGLFRFSEDHAHRSRNVVLSNAGLTATVAAETQFGWVRAALRFPH